MTAPFSTTLSLTVVSFAWDVEEFIKREIAEIETAKNKIGLIMDFMMARMFGLESESDMVVVTQKTTWFYEHCGR